MDATTASIRFGLGPRPGELAAIGDAPRDWLLAQLPGSDGPDGPDREEVVRRLVKAFRADDKEAFRLESVERYREDAQAAAEHAIRTATPFRERLVRFFSNHLAVSVARPEIRGLVGSYERHAIRPNLRGSYARLLVAAVMHPAMLIYLDNQRSVGPTSPIGERRGKGLNENLAREILELHTLGVDGGYEQRDVEGLARMLTGWTVVEDGDGFAFEPRMHEPGGHRMLGVTYRKEDHRQALEALIDLSVHPSTARHLATKLARHFVADDPPESAVRRLEEVWMRSQGNLPAVFAALVDLPEAWEQPLAKLRPPQELVIATARALGESGESPLLVHSMRSLGQTPWAAPSPQGWPDRAEDWAGPDALVARVDWVRRVATRAGDRRVLGRDLSRRELALWLASPEFQRR